MQRLNMLKESLRPWQAVRKRLDDARTLAELAEMEDDPEAYAPELQGELAGITKALDTLEVETLLSGPHDNAPAILEINAGRGRGRRQRLDFAAAADVPALGGPPWLQSRNDGRGRGRCGRA